MNITVCLVFRGYRTRLNLSSMYLTSAIILVHVQIFHKQMFIGNIPTYDDIILA